MREWLVDLVGEGMAPIASWILAAAIVVILVFVVITVAKKALGGSMGPRAKGRGPRLAVMDVAAIDPKRKLVLVRRDEVEHLLLIGGQNDLVVEPHILRVPAGARGQRTEPTLRPEPEAPMAPDRPAATAMAVAAPPRAAPQQTQQRLSPSLAQRPLEGRGPVTSPLARSVPRPPVPETATPTSEPAGPRETAAGAPDGALAARTDRSAEAAVAEAGSPRMAPAVELDGAKPKAVISGPGETVPEVTAAPEITVQKPGPTLRADSATVIAPVPAIEPVNTAGADLEPHRVEASETRSAAPPVEQISPVPMPTQPVPTPVRSAAPGVSADPAPFVPDAPLTPNAPFIPNVGVGPGRDAASAGRSAPRVEQPQPPLVRQSVQIDARTPAQGFQPRPVTVAPGGDARPAPAPLVRTPVGEGPMPARREIAPPPAQPRSMAAPVLPDASARQRPDGPPAASPAPGNVPMAAPSPSGEAIAGQARGPASAPADPSSRGQPPLASPAFTPGPFAPPATFASPAFAPPTFAPPTSAPPVFEPMSGTRTSAPNSPIIAAAERQREALRARVAPPVTGGGAPPPVERREPEPESDGTEKRPLSVRSFATTIQAMKPSYDPSAQPVAPAAAAPAQKLSQPPFVSAIVAPAPSSVVAPAPSSVVATPSRTPAEQRPAGPDSDGSLEDFLSAELDSDFGNVRWDDDVPMKAAPEVRVERPTAPSSSPPREPPAAPARSLTLEEEMERLLGDFDFEVSDRKAK